jgi:hypothetical protein
MWIVKLMRYASHRAAAEEESPVGETGHISKFYLN